MKSEVLAQGRKPIGSKWVFKIKNESDYLLRFKSRVVSKGYMQIPGVDYTEKFSPVATPTSVRAVLGLALWYRWPCELIDIEAAFLEGKLKSKTQRGFFIDEMRSGRWAQKSSSNAPKTICSPTMCLRAIIKEGAHLLLV